MSYTSNSIQSLATRVSKLQRIVDNIMAGCGPCCDDCGSGNATYFNVVGIAGNTITDSRLVGWDVALIAIDAQSPRNTGFTKVRASNIITLGTPLSGGETITLFLFKSTIVTPLPSSGFPYSFPAAFPGGGVSGFPYTLPSSFP